MNNYFVAKQSFAHLTAMFKQFPRTNVTNTIRRNFAFGNDLVRLRKYNYGRGKGKK